MTKNSTKKGIYFILLAFSAFFYNTAKAQSTVPKLKFCQPQLVAGINGALGATYKFANVTSGVDAYVKIEDINNGAILVNIDDSVVGYYNAWQPTVGGPNAAGSSYIKWNIEFKTPAGLVYTFATVDATAIDVDGDNASISEFVGVNGQSSYDVPTLIPTLLNVTSLSDTDNVNGDDPSATNLWSFGPITNRYDIDTASQDVRINYHFTNISKIKFYTGSTVGAPGGALNRYHSIYFMDIKNQNWSVLPVTYSTFNAILNNKMVNLSWAVNAELANDQFEVERSFDQTNFSTSGFVLGAQSVKNGFGQYSFDDKSAEILKHDVIYYRLKQLDKKGNATYSVVKMVRMPEVAAAKTTVQVMPNPYMDKLKINFESNTNGNAEIRLISASGTVVKKVASSISKGLNSFQIQDLRGQDPGMYVVNIVVNGKSVDSQKIIKN